MAETQAETPWILPVQAADEGYARKLSKYKLLLLRLAAYSTQSETLYRMMAVPQACNRYRSKDVLVFRG